ncbi:MAG: hypothetical protein ACKOER_06440, partial [Betaproteobacteria bacterium]
APDPRGLVSSRQMSVGRAANAVAAGVVVPLDMHSALALACASLGLLLVGWSAWKFDTAHSRPHS